MPFVSINNKDMITAVSDKPFLAPQGSRTLRIDGEKESRSLLGRRITKNRQIRRLAIIANWGQECGISTYTGYLVKQLRNIVPEVRIFSELGCEASDQVVPCWKRGQSMYGAMKEVLAWQPDFVLVQHEFGLFPKAPYLLQMLQMIDSIPYSIVLHSTYEHLDKTVCTSAMKQIITHTHVAKDVLRHLGNGNRIDVIPHGCITFTPEERKENWNIFQTPYAIVQFGFGFSYKGVDRAIDAIKLLRDRDEKYRDIFYCYLASENPHTKNIHSEYVDQLVRRVESHGLQDNVVIIRKYHSDQEINNYLRTAKLAIFPYLVNPGNTVYGASGAIRVAMANGIPTIASESHLFDELPVPRPASAEDLADSIDRIFSDWKYKDRLIATQDEYVTTNSWDKVSQSYLGVMQSIRDDMFLSIPDDDVY